MTLTIPASGLPGLDPASAPRSFTIVVESRNPEIGPSAHQVYDMLEFTRSTPGWDFGDREGYRCAFVEYFGAGGNLLFAINFERIKTPEVVASPYAVMLNDRGGIERSDLQVQGGARKGLLAPVGSDDLCGSGRGLSVPFDGTDHFPHGTMLRFTRNGNHSSICTCTGTTARRATGPPVTSLARPGSGGTVTDQRTTAMGT